MQVPGFEAFGVKLLELFGDSSGLLESKNFPLFLFVHCCIGDVAAQPQQNSGVLHFDVFS
jgi:hypothetical protein